jgi:glycosyltransferase involved in cell wall biosynthesis
LNILIVADRFFPTDPGGLARVAWDVAKALARRGHSVYFVAAESGPSKFEAFTAEVDGVHVHRFWRPLYPAWHPQRMSVPIGLYASAVKAILAEKQFDVVHFHSIFTGAAVMKACRGIAARPAVVYTVHSPVAQEQQLTWSRQGLIGLVNGMVGLPIVRRMERRQITFADETHVLSQFTAGELSKEHPGLTVDYRIIPHFVYDGWTRRLSRQDARSRLGWPLDIPCLFTVRQLRYRYGIDDAIEAVAPLASARRCCLFVAGAGPDRAHLQGLIDSRGCGDSIKLLGRVEDATLQVAYQAADLFLLPTRHLECFGLISLEAMSHGLPVLGTKVGAIPEVIGPILPGFLTPPSDPVAFRGKIEDFLSGRLSVPPEEEICRSVRASYAEDAVIGRYTEMYEDAIAKRTTVRRNATLGRCLN